MMRVLIAGCGYVGTAAAMQFREAGWEVEGWRASPPAAGDRVSIVAVDVTDKAAVSAQAGRGAFDAVVQCASTRGGDADAYRRIYLEASRHLRTAFPGARHFFVSSTSVYAQQDGEWVTEESPAEPRHETGLILRQTEDEVLAAGGVVLRLAGIYGPGRSALLEKFLSGRATLEPAGRERFVNQAHRDDIAAAIVFLADSFLRGNHAAPSERVFNVSDNHPRRRRECFAFLARQLARSLPPVAAEETGERRRGSSNKRVSSARLLARGWTPRYPTFEEAMKKSILPSWPGIIS